LLSGNLLKSALGGASQAATITTPIVTAVTAESAANVSAIAAQTAALSTALAANFAKPSFLGTTFERGGIVSAAGGWALPSFSGTTPALLHANEMVLPSDISQGLQGMIKGGGGGGHVINISAVDANSVARLFKSNGSAPRE